MSSLERLGEAGWLPDVVRSEESLLYHQACNQPTVPLSVSQSEIPRRRRADRSTALALAVLA